MPTALLVLRPAFLPFPITALELRGDRARGRAPFRRCWVGEGTVVTVALASRLRLPRG